MANVPLNPTPQVAQMPRAAVGPEPCSMTCPVCGVAIETYVQTKPTTQTHIIAMLLCCVCILCTFIPYCIDSCQSVEHYCPNCEARLGTYQR